MPSARGAALSHPRRDPCLLSAVDTLLTGHNDEGLSITAKPLIYLVALQGLEPRTCGL